MRVEANSRHAELIFTVYAENATDRALLTLFTNSQHRKGRTLAVGETYECNLSAVTSFTISWLTE